MFRATFNNTVKTLLRARSYWVAVLMFAVLVYYSWEMPFPGESVTLDLPVPILYDLAQLVRNEVAAIMIWPFPLFSVITVAMVHERDHDDQFFGIEKSLSIKPSLYLAGRICALITVNLTTVAIFSFARLNFDVCLRGGFRTMPMGEYLATSTFYLLKHVFMFCLPTLLYYIGSAYLIGMLFRSGKAVAYGGFGHVILHYFYWLNFRRKYTHFYFWYLSPAAENLGHYVAYWGVKGAEKPLAFFGTKPIDALISASFFVGVFALGMLLSYFFVRRREA